MLARILLAGCLITSLTIGCSSIAPTRKDVLRRAQMRPDSIALDIVFVRYRDDDDAMGDGLWREIDELAITPELRERLDANGFRVGVIGGRVPQVLETRMAIGDKPKIAQTGQVLNLDDEPKVTGRHLQLRPGKHGEIQNVAHS